ncbi:MAG: WD40 repeat domain-containing protein [Acidobacteria bacterium]|nr:WD40 repeat domain-containing protein [Acidobacteriota bacterium]
MWGVPIVLAAATVLESPSEVGSVVFSRDGKSVTGSARDGKLRVWDVASRRATSTIERAAEGGGAPMLLASAPGQFAVVGKDGTVTIRAFDGNGKERRISAGAKPRVSCVATSAQGAIGGASMDSANPSGNMVRVWDATGAQRFGVPAGLGGTSALVFSPDGKYLVGAAYDTDLRIWNSENGELLRVVSDMTVSMFALAFSPDGKLLAAAGVDCTIYLFDTKTWTVLRRITGQPEMISALAFSPDGRRIVTGGMNELLFGSPVKVMVWDNASGQALHTFDAEHRVTAAAFSPDGAWVAAADGSKLIKLWAAAK